MHPDQLQQQIRFQISQLSPSNGQADFEKICLFFSRNRIHKNILPATGPVQAGGDQGSCEVKHSAGIGKIEVESGHPQVQKQQENGAASAHDELTENKSPNAPVLKSNKKDIEAGRRHQCAQRIRYDQSHPIFEADKCRRDFADVAEEHGHKKCGNNRCVCFGMKHQAAERFGCQNSHGRDGKAQDDDQGKRRGG